MRTPIKALKEIRDRLTYFCLRTDGRYDPPWATELVGIIDESVTGSHAVGNAPARNCDLYDNWYDAHQAWERLPKDELGYFVAANGVHECEQAWLLAPAAERKGE